MPESKNTGYSVKSRVWIEDDQGTFLAEGRVDLLDRINEFGSITKAAKSMKMSYRKAWELVDSMNMSAKLPLVVRTTGGKGGGGTSLTPAGEQAIVTYRNLNKRCKEFLAEELKNLAL